MAELLYLTIANTIKQRILTGEYKPGDMLNSESSMIKEFDVSRMTIRKSLAMLSNEGYIYSVPGKGSFVCTPETDFYQFRFNKYEDLAVSIDDVRLLGVDIDGSNKRIKRRLRAEPDNLILHARRLLTHRGSPVAMEIIHFIYIPNHPVVEEQLKFASHIEGMGQVPDFALEKDISISGMEADESLAASLGISVGDTVFCLEEEMLNMEESTVSCYTQFYILPQYFILKATTIKDDKTKV